jgi:hypothetical protein
MTVLVIETKRTGMEFEGHRSWHPKVCVHGLERWDQMAIDSFLGWLWTARLHCVAWSIPESQHPLLYRDQYRVDEAISPNERSSRGSGQWDDSCYVFAKGAVPHSSIQLDVLHMSCMLAIVCRI